MAFKRKSTDSIGTDEEMVISTVKMDINEAAKLLMEFLPQETQDRILEAREGFKVPLWQMLLGYVMKCRDRDEVWSPHLLSMWEDGLSPNAPRPCKTCGQTFKSKFPEAMFCCNPCHFGKIAELGHAPTCPTRSSVLVA